MIQTDEAVQDPSQESQEQQEASAPTLGSAHQPQESQQAQQSQQPQGSQQADDWRNLIPEEIRGEAAFANVKDVEDLAQQFINAQKLIGREKIPMPKDEEDKEAWENLYKAVGRPEDPSEYELPEDFNLPEGFEVDEEALEDFKKVFHGAGMSKKQFAIAVKRYQDHVTQQHEAQQQKMQEMIQQGLTALGEEWGDDYQKNLDLANGALDVLSQQNPELKQLFEKNSYLANHPAILKAFAKIGESVQEHSFRSGGGEISFNPDSRAHALQMLRDFEERYQDEIFNPAAKKLTPQKRQELLDERARLYRLAYDEE